MMIDGDGRFVVPKNVVVEQPDAFYAQTGELDFRSIWQRAAEGFQVRPLPSVGQMGDVCGALRENILADDRLSNLFRMDGRPGIHLPWFIPQMEIPVRNPEIGDYDNPGTILNRRFLPDVRVVYTKQFPGANFIDSRRWGVDTDGVVNVVDPGQRKLIELLRDGPVFGWIFPVAFQGVSGEDARSLINTLQDGRHNFTLGGFDCLAAMILHPETLAAQSTNTPTLQLGAFGQFQHEDGKFLCSRCNMGFPSPHPCERVLSLRPTDGSMSVGLDPTDVRVGRVTIALSVFGR